MKTAIVISVAPTSFEALALSRDVEGAFALAAAEGFDGVEIAVRDPSLVSAAALKTRAQDHGLAIAAIGTGQAFLAEGLSLSSSEASVRRAAAERLKRQLELGRELQAPVIIGLIRGSREKKEEVPAVLELLAEGLFELDEYCRQIDAPGLLLEPINRYETRLINSLAEGCAFLEKYPLPSVRLLADTFHMNIEDRDMAEALRRAGRRLGHMHFADSNRWAPGQGHLNFEPLFAALTEISYSGFLSAEILPEPSPDEAVRLTARFFRAWTRNSF